MRDASRLKEFTQAPLPQYAFLRSDGMKCKTIDMNTGLLTSINNWYEYWSVELLSAQGLSKEKKLVLAGTILKKGKFQSKYIVSLA